MAVGVTRLHTSSELTNNGHGFSITSMAAIFIDQVSALYRTIRSLVVKGGPSDEALPWIIQQLNFGPEDTRSLTMELLELSALQQADVPHQFQAQMADLCHGAHFTLSVYDNPYSRIEERSRGDPQPTCCSTFAWPGSSTLLPKG